MGIRKQRVEWVDLAKAFAIYCVVFGHVEVFSMNHYGGFFYRLQDLFCMPLFFLLSGMFAKPQLTIKDSWQCLVKRFLQLMIPFVATGSLYVLLRLNNRPWWSLIWYPDGGAHMGYWFLLVLFEMYCIFTVCQIITRKCRLGSLAGYGFLSVALVVWLLMIVVYFLKKDSPEEVWSTVVTFSRLYYNFPFFIIGYWLMNNRIILERLLRKNVFAISSFLFVLLYVAYDKYELRSVRFILLPVVIVSILYLFKSLGGVNLFLSKYVNYCGRHTLEIYVLHYFFIPFNMPYLNDIIAPYGVKDNNIVIELFLNSFVAFIVIAASLISARIIAENKILSQILLGRKIV